MNVKSVKSYIIAKRNYHKTRIHLDKFQPKVGRVINYSFQVIVDGEVIKNGILTNFLLWMFMERKY